MISYIFYFSEEILTEPKKSNYGAELLSPQISKPSNLPIIGPSMKAHIDYANNKRRMFYSITKIN